MYSLNALTTESGRKGKILTDYEIIGPFSIWFAYAKRALEVTS
jgi:hypothetical protein